VSARHWLATSSSLAANPWRKAACRDTCTASASRDQTSPKGAGAVAASCWSVCASAGPASPPLASV